MRPPSPTAPHTHPFHVPSREWSIARLQPSLDEESPYANGNSLELLNDSIRDALETPYARPTRASPDPCLGG